MQIVTREDFLQTEVGAAAQAELQRMVNSGAYTTVAAYDVAVGHKVAFIDRHINYLVKHPHITPTTYLSNLKIMARAKR